MITISTALFGAVEIGELQPEIFGLIEIFVERAVESYYTPHTLW